MIEYSYLGLRQIWAAAILACSLLGLTAYAADMGSDVKAISVAEFAAKPSIAPTSLSATIHSPSEVAPPLVGAMRAAILDTQEDDEGVEEEAKVAQELNDLTVASDLSLRARYVLLIDKLTNKVVYHKSADSTVPIASITKLMSALVIMNAGMDLSQKLRVERADLVGGGKRKLRPGIVMERRAFLKLALMSSDNVAAHVLGRTYKGGMTHFVSKMNATARQLGMEKTHFVEPTGLDSKNQSSAWDLIKLLDAAQGHDLIRKYSTAESERVKLGRRLVRYQSSNGLVRSGTWSIDIQKTGFINAAGRCLVMQFRLHDRPFVAVLLDSHGKMGRIVDALAIRSWLEQHYSPLNTTPAKIVQVAAPSAL